MNIEAFIDWLAMQPNQPQLTVSQIINALHSRAQTPAKAHIQPYLKFYIQTQGKIPYAESNEKLDANIRIGKVQFKILCIIHANPNISVKEVSEKIRINYEWMKQQGVRDRLVQPIRNGFIVERNGLLSTTELFKEKWQEIMGRAA